MLISIRSRHSLGEVRLLKDARRVFGNLHVRMHGYSLLVGVSERLRNLQSATKTGVISC